jgi:S-DNA-T family DNA segregation ATPase FtsK/SpoIIIE
VDRCEECGLVYADVALDEVPHRLRAGAAAVATRIAPSPSAEATGSAPLRSRPAPDVWSALEYACHVRDVLGVQRERLALALAQDRPAFEPMGREERVVELRYNEQDPATVAAELAAAAEEAASAFAALDAGGWDRVGIYNWPAPAERTMAWLGRHTVHEVEHHGADIERLLGASP